MNTLTNENLSQMVDHFKLRSIHYQTEMSVQHGTRINPSTVFTDSEDDDIPLSTYVRDINDHSKLDSNISTPGVSVYSHQQNLNSSGGYILVKYVTRNTEYRYAEICSSVDDEDGELRVTFLKICKQNGTLFKFNEKDVSDVLTDHLIIGLLDSKRFLLNLNKFLTISNEVVFFVSTMSPSSVPWQSNSEKSKYLSIHLKK